ncbi:MAG: thiamine pyrophosphate-dependent dehydrogenase E1 component subunit alpha [Dehalococcoidia bacterium]|nr:thiamine pyrophosphate-dependent dehydrogenase E1 component subunit alpha [Dehalococcoidia bacterium]MCA9824340.1 thiamine pyrophosphate-dependent dehydrogenase E1 component subunit alpha [Dehalococcoidia bacterium]MCA9844000.1 thiamine pyrophosphate-dependent dehydrogenase E1 component subunit alpha [Dehalococcoidia bacterium]MCA9852889.1 thiamine pyrophosphate-dependent dehydrogenase E1 component subunit alpha [Dehalococcoidia bacterium]
MTTEERRQLSDAPVPNYHLSERQLERMYYYMRLSRSLNERMMALQRQGRAAFVIAGAGQEAAQVGAAMALRPGVDWLAPYYRDLGMNIVLGMTAREAMLNELAKADDPNSFGRQMPAHWGSVSRKIVTQSSVVATQLLHATGIALGAKMRNDPIVVLTCCGEGSTSRGDFHEALNFAAIHKLPVIFYVQNNGYAISEPTVKEMPVEHVADRGQAYGIRGQVVDGMDVVAVYQTLRPAVELTRRGNGPFLIEAKCYRLWAHSSDDDDTRYRPRKELEEWALKDPVVVFRQRLLEDGMFAEEELAEIDELVTQEVRDAVEWAQQMPDPKPEDALGYVYREVQ